METEKISIRLSRLSEGLAAISKINKKAAKNGIDGVSINVSEPYGKLESRYDSNHPFFSAKDKINRQYVDVTVSIQPVVINGYRPIATLDFSHDEPTVFTWPGEEMGNNVPNNGECTHCGKNRRRARIFVLEHNETDAREYVGTACVRDFLGYDPKAIMEQLTIIREIESFGEGDEENPYGSVKGKRIFDLAEVLANTVATIRKYGWISSKKAMESEEGNLTATSFRVGILSSPLMADPAYRKEWEWYIKGIKVTQADRDKANVYLEYVKGIEYIPNDYTRNLTIIGKDGYCTQKEFSLAVSMVNFAENGMNRQAEWKKEKEAKESKKAQNENKHLGNVGDKLTGIEVTVTLVKEVGTQYGISYLTKFETKEGNFLTWFASKDNGLNAGDSVVLEGKVKSHNEFKGTNETMVTRCKIS